MRLPLIDPTMSSRSWFRLPFTRGLPGKASQNDTFLISQAPIRSAAEWRAAANPADREFAIK
jgi:hypothetical protein